MHEKYIPPLRAKQTALCLGSLEEIGLERSLEQSRAEQTAPVCLQVQAQVLLVFLYLY